MSVTPIIYLEDDISFKEFVEHLHIPDHEGIYSVTYFDCFPIFNICYSNILYTNFAMFSHIENISKKMLIDNGYVFNKREYKEPVLQIIKQNQTELDIYADEGITLYIYICDTDANIAIYKNTTHCCVDKQELIQHVLIQSHTEQTPVQPVLILAVHFP